MQVQLCWLVVLVHFISNEAHFLTVHHNGVQSPSLLQTSSKQRASFSVVGENLSLESKFCIVPTAAPFDCSTTSSYFHPFVGGTTSELATPIVFVDFSRNNIFCVKERKSSFAVLEIPPQTIHPSLLPILTLFCILFVGLCIVHNSLGGNLPLFFVALLLTYAGVTLDPYLPPLYLIALLFICVVSLGILFRYSKNPWVACFLLCLAPPFLMTLENPVSSVFSSWFRDGGSFCIKYLLFPLSLALFIRQRLQSESLAMVVCVVGIAVCQFNWIVGTCACLATLPIVQILFPIAEEAKEVLEEEVKVEREDPNVENLAAQSLQLPKTWHATSQMPGVIDCTPIPPPDLSTKSSSLSAPRENVPLHVSKDLEAKPKEENKEENSEPVTLEPVSPEPVAPMDEDAESDTRHGKRPRSPGSESRRKSTKVDHAM